MADTCIRTETVPVPVSDGDCTGSCMGLYLYILENYPEKQTDIYLEELPDSFHFLQRSGEIRQELSEDRDYDLFCCLDCGDKERLGFSGELFDRAAHTLCVDHHISNTNFGEENYVVPDASSTSELMYNLMDKDRITLPVPAHRRLPCGRRRIFWRGAWMRPR